MIKSKKNNKILINTLKLIDLWLEYKQFTREIPGMSIEVYYGGKTVFSKNYGLSCEKTKEKMNSLSIYRIASQSKIFTALGILKLVDTGKMHLEDKVSDILSWFSGDQKITVKQLLTHNIVQVTNHWRINTIR